MALFSVLLGNAIAQLENYQYLQKGFNKGKSIKRLLRTNSVNFEQGNPLTLIQEIQTEVKFTDRNEPLCNKTKQTKEILPFVTT